jgi:hypothetical protein
MEKTKRSTRILAIAIIAAAALTGFAISATVSASSAAQISEVGSKETRNSGSEPIAVQSETQHNKTEHKTTQGDKHLDQSKVAELRIAQHHLWVEHVVWTRQYIVATVADAPDTQAAAERLLRNQEEIGNAIKPVYGEEAGNKLTALLKDHILIAVDLLNAAKAGDNAALEDAESRWQANADDIATFLSEANPNWPKEEMVNMLNEHLTLTKSEAVARLTGDYASDVVAFDAVVKHAESMADGFTNGIVAQFPEQFEENTKVGED